MGVIRIAILAQEATEHVSEKKDLYPKPAELIAAAIAFAIIFFIWKWVLPRVNTMLEERRQQIQGQLESAEDTRRQAEQELQDYRAQLANAREEGNRIIEEARTTADQLRRDIQASAEQEAQNTVARAPGGDPRRAGPRLQRAPDPGRRDRRRSRRSCRGPDARHEDARAADRRVHRAGRLGREGSELTGMEFLDRIFGKGDKAAAYATALVAVAEAEGALTKVEDELYAFSQSGGAEPEAAGSHHRPGPARRQPAGD